MTTREKKILLMISTELGKTRARLEEMEKELELLKENQYDLHTEVKEIYRIVNE